MDVVAAADVLPENSGDGLNGYIDTWYNTNPAYQYGASYYATAWPLLTKPLQNYQVGLPSTWFIPNNTQFKQPLCPEGTVARNWPDRGPTWSDVFQTMEGGLGNWAGTPFQSSTPKFQLGGTGNCYSQTVTQLGWGSINWPAPLPAPKMGVAQLSNRILMPPDGLTLDPSTNGEQLGIAYMPIPMLPKQTTPQPTGDHSWTLFLNAANFSGPVAFYLPNFWSRLSQTYSTISGRGFDALPAVMDTTAMEVNTVPYFENKDATGTTYSRIPALHFPVDSTGFTTLSQGVTFYNADAFYNPVKEALAKHLPVPAAFGTGKNLSMSPTCSNDPLSFTQTADKIPITGLDKIVKTSSKTQSGQCTFGLQWIDKSSAGVFPEYYKQQGTTRVPISASAVPTSTQLQLQTFQPASVGSGYPSVHKLGQNKYWKYWVKSQAPVKVTLNDGSVVSYLWYKFVDQPAIKALGLTAAEANKLQNTVVQLHKSWANQHTFMQPPPSGDLVKLDRALMVTPPKGLEYGYVPIPTSQLPAARTKAQTFMYDAKTKQPTELPEKLAKVASDQVVSAQSTSCCKP